MTTSRSQGGKRVVLLTAILFTGCNKSNLGVVTGTISVDGMPAKSGSIAFFPTNRKSSTAGSEIVDGRYTAKVALGAAKVEIRVPKVVGKKKLYDKPDSPMKEVLSESLPRKYNDETELKLDIHAGENVQDYELATQ